MRPLVAHRADRAAHGRRASCLRRACARYVPDAPCGPADVEPALPGCARRRSAATAALVDDFVLSETERDPARAQRALAGGDVVAGAAAMIADRALAFAT